MLHRFVVAAAAQEPFDFVGVRRHQIGSRKKGKGARVSVGAKPCKRLARARLSYVVTPLTTQGRLSGAVLVFRDMTQRKQQLAGQHAAQYKATAAEQTGRQAEVRGHALEDQAERDKLMAQSALHEHRHHWLTAAATLLEIAIAICTVAIVTRKRPFWLGSLGLGAVGLVLLGAAYLL